MVSRVRAAYFTGMNNRLRFLSRFCFLLVLLGLGGTAAWAQALPPDTLLNETFRTNEQDWAITRTDDELRELGPEGYHLQYLSAKPTGNLIAHKVLPLNDLDDYSLEVRLRLRGQAGLLWGYRTDASGRVPSDFQMLRLEVDRVTPQVALWHLRDNTWEKQFIEPVPAGFDAAAVHSLRVARGGVLVRFYLDGRVLPYEQPALGWPGPDHDVGLYLENGGDEAWVRQLLVRHHSLIRLAPGIPRGLRRERLGNGISTEREELVPLIAANGRSLFFTRSMGDPTIPANSNTDIFMAERGADGTWGQPHSLGSPVNTPQNNSITQVAPDGQSLLIAGLYDAAGNKRDGGVSQTTRQADGTWSSPLIFVEGLVIPNVADYIFRFIDASGTVALVAGDTRDNPGKSDIYVSLRQPDDSWPALRSLGPTLNTAGREMSPFLAPDGKTLYFSSDSFPGYGRSDVFVSTRLDDSWTKWSPPLNLGPGVNTPRGDAYFSLPASGEYAYLVSKELGAVPYDSDIYRLLLPAALKPAATVLVRGRVLDARTNQPIANAEMRYEQLPAGKEVGRLRLGGAGTYEIALPAGQQYGFRAEAPGYLAASNNLDLSATTTYAERTQDLFLLPLAEPVEAAAARVASLQLDSSAPAAPGQLKTVAVAAAVEDKITLHNLFFVQGKPVLLPTSFPELNRLAETLAAHPALQIRLDGHTDNTGDAKDPKPNQILSEQRAAAVRDYLVRQRIALVRLSTRGYGGSQPVAPNDSEAHKARNRRVEFVIVGR